MPDSASELARRLAENAEAVCRHYLPSGRRDGRWWTVGDIENTPEGTWRLSADAESTLRAMGERRDIVRTMQRALGAERRPLEIHADRAPQAPIVGRIAGKGLVDELQDRAFLVVDGVDGRAHYVALPSGADPADFPKGGIVEVAPSSVGPKAADRTIARLAEGAGLYRVDEHVAEAQRAARSGDDPAAYVEAHVRRLEALRRAGLVERVDEGVWRLPPDYLDRAAVYEAGRSAGLSVRLRSHLGLPEQVRSIGATWLDRSLLGGEMAPAAGGGRRGRPRGARRARSGPGRGGSRDAARPARRPRARSARDAAGARSRQGRRRHRRRDRLRASRRPRRRQRARRLPALACAGERTLRHARRRRGLQPRALEARD